MKTGTDGMAPPIMDGPFLRWIELSFEHLKYIGNKFWKCLVLVRDKILTTNDTSHPDEISDGEIPILASVVQQGKRNELFE